MHFLLQFAVALLGRRKLGEQAFAGDSILRTEMVVRPLATSGLIDEGAEIFVSVQKVAVHARAGDDDPSADPSLFAAEVGDRLEDRCTFSG